MPPLTIAPDRLRLDDEGTFAQGAQTACIIRRNIMLTLYKGFDNALAREIGWMDRMLDGFGPRPAYRHASWPPVNVVESDEALEITAEVPGLAPDDVEITLHDGELKIEGKHQSESESEEHSDGDSRKVLFRERRSLGFTRTFRLNVEVDPERVSATVKDGLLTVSLPKAAAVQPKRIAVSGK